MMVKSMQNGYEIHWCSGFDSGFSFWMLLDGLEGVEFARLSFTSVYPDREIVSVRPVTLEEFLNRHQAE